MNGLLDPEAFENDVNFYRSQREGAYDVADEPTVDRFGQPLGSCEAEGCTGTRHAISDSRECAAHTLARVMRDAAEGGVDDYIAAEMERWTRIAGAK